jgi:hypothetical protein
LAPSLAVSQRSCCAARDGATRLSGRDADDMAHDHAPVDGALNLRLGEGSIIRMRTHSARLAGPHPAWLTQTLTQGRASGVKPGHKVVIGVCALEKKARSPGCET